MNRRQVLGASTAISMFPALRFAGVARADDATPIPPSSVAPVVSDYAEVGPLFNELRDAMVVQGREIIDTLFSDSAASVWDRLTPELQSTRSKEDLALVLPFLTTNRVHFELEEFGAIFDGHLVGSTIEGAFFQGFDSTFSLTSQGSQIPALAPNGLWRGQIDTGGQPLRIEVTFQMVNGTFSGAISLPDQNLLNFPLAQVSFTPIVPLGERSAEQAGQLSPVNRFYIARYPWAETEIAVFIGFTVDGQVDVLSVLPEWPLPADPAASSVSSVSYQLPFAGLWLVIWGGDTRMQNYHVVAPAQRHAFDIMIWKDGGTFNGDGTNNEDYWAFGQPLVAPAGGTVVDVLDGIADNTPGETNTRDHVAGNHIVIQTAENEFLYLAHFKQGSVQVQLGDILSVGDPLGLTGNTGNSSEPHLHIHLQNRSAIDDPAAIGLPLAFSSYRANDAFVDIGVPIQGQFVQQA